MSPRSTKKNSGRPRNEVAKIAFEKIINCVEQNDEEQFSIPALVQKMKQMCRDVAYTNAI
jgi:hypothetical protein